MKVTWNQLIMYDFDILTTEQLRVWPYWLLPGSIDKIIRKPILGGRLYYYMALEFSIMIGIMQERQ